MIRTTFGQQPGEVRASPWIAELRLALLEFAAEAVADDDRRWLKGRSETLFSLGGREYLGADVFRHLQWLVDGEQVRARDYSISHDHRWLLLGLTSRGAEVLDRLRSRDHPAEIGTGGRLPSGIPVWYAEEWVPTNQTAGNEPSREDDVIACRKRFGDAVPVHLVRDLRRVLAPEKWKAKGRRPKK